MVIIFFPKFRVFQATMMMIRCGVAAAMAAATAGAAVDEWGAGHGLTARPAPHVARQPRSTPGFAPIFCAGTNGYQIEANETSNDIFGDQGHQGLWVNQTQSDCTSITLPLVAAYIGGDVGALLACVSVGPHAPTNPLLVP